MASMEVSFNIDGRASPADYHCSAQGTAAKRILIMRLAAVIYAVLIW
ncbi:MAG: hypothetical protein H9917_05885 [Candidatus Oceanisphaera merdipullorum]|nr:hypothetical protein [Candidatus Oceanisphaera merdipullorum]